MNSQLSHAILSNGDSVALFDAMARTERGNKVPMTFKSEAGQLVLEVETPPDMEQVVATTSFDYNYTYGVVDTDPTTAHSMLNECFNCYFWLPGAPSHFPAIGELLPLGLLGANFNVIMREWYSDWDGDGSFWFTFTLDATADHVDGAGSWISFTFFSPHNSSLNEMIVYAYVADFQIGNPLGGTELLYKAGTHEAWQGFASRITTITP